MTQIEEILENVDSLPPTPQLLPKLLNLLGNADSNFHEIIATINMDPALTAQVLRLSNSAFYGLSTPCSDLNDAVQRIGFSEVYKLVCIICSKDILDESVEAYGIESGRLWELSLATAMMMEVMYEKTPQAYTTGMIHAVGKLVFSKIFKDRYAEVYEMIEAEEISQAEAERRTFGFHNAHLGGALLKKWNFPMEIYIPITYQYAPKSTNSNVKGACALHLATWVVASVGLNPGDSSWAIVMNPAAAHMMKFSEEQLKKYVLMAHSKLSDISNLVSLTC